MITRSIKDAIKAALIIGVGMNAAWGSSPKGTINGRIIDTDTKWPLAGANVVLVDTPYGASTDLEGDFQISNVPVGSYVIQFSYLGYEPKVVPDVIVKSQRITTIEAELEASVLETDEVTVQPDYFTESETQPTSVVNMTSEEIRRAPGSAGDVSRIIMALPSVAKVNDTRNNLVVRGGSPMENGYFLDNIGIPNINHFPSQGSSGGAMALVNVDFIKDVNFYSGGFSPVYGDRLSSITDLTYREGNRNELDGQLDLSFQGFGIVTEGPLPGRNGSWMFSARRSYWDLVIDAFNIEASTVPEIVDVQGKASYDLGANHQLTFLDILGVDESIIKKAQSEENRENNYGEATWNTNALGVNWRYLWGKWGYSNTSLSHSYMEWDSHWHETITDSLLTTRASTEQTVWLRNVNHYNINPGNHLDFGFEVRLIDTQYDNLFAAYTDPLGNPTPELHMDDDLSTIKAGSFLSFRRNFMGLFTANPGIRVDYSELNDNLNISPRFQFKYQLGANMSLNGAYGQFYQYLPVILVSQQKAFKELKDPMADHYVLGISHLLSEDTRLTIEAYAKEYRNMPLDPTQPSLFVIDESGTLSGFSGHEQLVDKGKAYTRGIELMVQKKLAKRLYGIISGSYFRSRYRGYDGQWRDRIYDNRYMATLEGGYKPDNKWEFSMRWIYAGGAPYTPFDVEASEAAQRGIYDEDRINEERLPDYHSLNLRVDRRFHFRASNLILYLSIWNAYARENIAEYFWNEQDNKLDHFEQWGTIASVGLEFEF